MFASKLPTWRCNNVDLIPELQSRFLSLWTSNTVPLWAFLSPLTPRLWGGGASLLINNLMNSLETNERSGINKVIWIEFRSMEEIKDFTRPWNENIHVKEALTAPHPGHHPRLDPSGPVLERFWQRLTGRRLRNRIPTRLNQLIPEKTKGRPEASVQPAHLDTYGGSLARSLAASVA